MLLTKDMIYARLEKRYPLQMHGTGTCSQLRSCLIYDGKELKANRVYLTTPEQMNRLDEGSGCLILCSGKYVPVKDTQDVIFVESQPEILELLAAVTEIFDEFHTWEEQAFACGDDMTGMEQFLNLSGDLMEASFFLVDSYYSFASYNHRARRLKSMFDPQDPHRPSQDILQSLVDDPEIYQLIDRRGAFLYSGSTGAGESICLGLNLFLHGAESFSYRLLMICDDVNYSKWKWDMLERIGTIAERSLSRMTSADQQNRFFSDLKIQLRNTLWDPQISVVSLSAMLQGLSWDLEHHCQVYVFYPFQKGISPGSGEYVCSRLERLFQETVTFLMDDTIVMVRNASVSLREKTVFHELLAEFLKEHLYKVGISTDSPTIAQIRQAYTQAKAAYGLGSERQPHYWYYKFEDYTLDYIIGQSTAELPGQMLLPKAISILREYDSTHDSNLLGTLYAYIREKYNATHAAQSLYIHRTTFLDRMERIKQLTNVDLDSMESRLMLMVAYKIMGQQEFKSEK